MTTTDAAADFVPEACDMNLGPRQRRRRLKLGYAMTVLSLAAGAALLLLEAPRPARLALIPIVDVALLGYLQFAART